jgi:hypothetical protein
MTHLATQSLEVYFQAVRRNSFEKNRSNILIGGTSAWKIYARL